jgi:hypothetical protein
MRATERDGGRYLRAWRPRAAAAEPPGRCTRECRSAAGCTGRHPMPPATAPETGARLPGRLCRHRREGAQRQAHSGLEVLQVHTGRGQPALTEARAKTSPAIDATSLQAQGAWAVRVVRTCLHGRLGARVAALPRARNVPGDCLSIIRLGHLHAQVHRRHAAMPAKGETGACVREAAPCASVQAVGEGGWGVGGGGTRGMGHLRTPPPCKAAKRT